MKCTWLNCQETATIPLIDSKGNTWANLCPKHAAEHDNGVTVAIQNAEDADANKPNVKRLLSNWVKANGGAEELMKKL